MGRKVVPFGRNIALVARGPDTRAVKRALARAGHGKLGTIATSAPIFGPVAVLHLRAWKKTVPGLPVTSVYGLASHRQLVPHFDDYCISEYTRGASEPRDRIIAAALALYAVRDLILYTQGPHRMTIVRKQLRPPFPPETIWEDCSSAATGVYWIADIADPNGRDYDGYGWTGTLCEHGRPVTLEQAQPGDLVFYGPGPPWTHVAVYLGGGRVWSHGSNEGPLILLIDYRPDRGQVRSYVPANV